jgi:hypothetical protein
MYVLKSPQRFLDLRPDLSRALIQSEFSASCSASAKAHDRVETVSAER